MTMMPRRNTSHFTKKPRKPSTVTTAFGMNLYFKNAAAAIGDKDIQITLFKLNASDITAAIKEGLEKARHQAKSKMKNGKSLLQGFEICELKTITLGGCGLSVQFKGGTLLPRSHFGEPREDRITRRTWGRVSYERVLGVQDDSGEWFPLEPRARVYNRETGHLTYTAP